jgi:hypothetical protein
MYPNHRGQLEQRPNEPTSRSKKDENDSVREFVYFVHIVFLSI